MHIHIHTDMDSYIYNANSTGNFQSVHNTIKKMFIWRHYRTETQLPDMIMMQSGLTKFDQIWIY